MTPRSKQLFLFFALMSFCAASVDADDAKTTFGISSKFPGEYQLIQKSGDGADKYCPEVLKVSISAASVVVSGSAWFPAWEVFSFAEAGCRKKSGDIGTSRSVCMNFHEKEVSSTDTSLLTIVGFIREYAGIRLGTFDSDILTYEHSSTQIPFGIFGIWDADKFRCSYKRISS
jgi:hypothetical protein